MPISVTRTQLWIAAAVLTAVVFVTRWPTFSTPIWNLDEAIHATVARSLLDGGVLYRDAIDQRNPLTYYLVAGVLAIFGENNLWALRALTAVLIAATSWLLFVIGSTWQGRSGGLWAAGLFASLSTSLLYAGDAFALNTEWFVAFFTAAAAALLWCLPGAPTFRRTFGAGALLAMAFLSKQPALLDAAAPVAGLLALAFWQPAGRRALVAQLLGFAGGFAVAVGIVALYFALNGAWSDLWFYTWTYNLKYYGPAVATAPRFLTAFLPLDWLLEQEPVLFVAAAGGLLLLLTRLVQREPTATERMEHPLSCHVGIWFFSSWAAAVSGGRGFGHYFIQWLPAFCLVAAFGLTLAGRLTATRGPWLRWTVRLFGLFAAGSVLVHVWRARQAVVPLDSSFRAAEFVRQHTAPNDRIFVWGYHPDFYVYADRPAASRFVYASFITGLIPWHNVEPDRDTRYAEVPGTLDILLRELERNRPTFIVDCSAGPNRHWDKYPLERFPALQEFIRARYVVVEPDQFLRQGYRLFQLKDEFRRQAVALAGGPGGSPTAEIFGANHVEPRPGTVAAAAHDPAGRLQRLELLVDGRPFAGISFPPSAGLTARFEVPFDRFPGKHRLTARATSANGVAVESTPNDTVTELAETPMALRAAFAIPRAEAGIPALSVTAPFGAGASSENGSTVYFAHAPSRIAYAVPAGASLIRGRIGFRAGAYAANNRSPTDGAEFIIEFVRADGQRYRVFSKLLRPREEEADRLDQAVSAELPHGAAGTVEFIISPGPHDDSSSDWTYWADLRFVTSP